MTKNLKLIAVVLLGVITICGYSFLTDKTNYKEWSITKLKSDTAEICWAKFVWTNETLFGKYYKRASMQIPCKIEGLPYKFSFQFDLGADLTGIYEYNLSSFYKLYPDLSKNIKRLKSPLQFWNSKKSYNDLSISFGCYTAKNKNAFLHCAYGDKFTVDNLNKNDTFHIGTIGADLFQGKVLIIDYPNQQFAICDTVPSGYNCNFTSIELDKNGRVLLPLELKDKNYKAMFDNGSSLFPLIVTDDKINNFSTLPNTDTFKGYAWGKSITMIGRPINDSFILAGHTFYQTMVYTDYRQEYRTDKYDAVTGNILFWDKTIIIDFKNKKFGVK